MKFSVYPVLALAAATLVSFIAIPSVSAQTTSDAGFETQIFGNASYGSFAYDPTNVGWTFANSSGISGNGSQFTGSNPNAPEGVQVAFLQRDGTISQSISGFQGGSYTFQFDAAQRVAGTNGFGGGINNGYSSDLQNFQIFLDGTALYGTAGITPDEAVGGITGGYQLYTTGPIALSAGTHVVTIPGLNTAYLAAGRTGNADLSDNTAFIDAFGINQAAPVPEASSVASFSLLMILGLGSFAISRRRKVQAI